MRVGASQDLTIQHMRQLDVECVPGLTRDFSDAIDIVNWSVYDCVLFHPFSLYFPLATASTALIMLL